MTRLLHTDCPTCRALIDDAREAIDSGEMDDAQFASALTDYLDDLQTQLKSRLAAIEDENHKKAREKAVLRDLNFLFGIANDSHEKEPEPITDAEIQTLLDAEDAKIDDDKHL